jgi:putative heme iron utilization protein
MLEAAPYGMLATHCSERPGYPFGSIAPFALDRQGCPLFLISYMAVHTGNLEANPKAALFVFEPDASGDPVRGARVTLMGDVVRLTDEERAAVRDLYLARYPQAEQWIDFGDFSFYRMDVAELYLVGGFGVMGWVKAEDWAAGW